MSRFVYMLMVLCSCGWLACVHVYAQATIQTMATGSSASLRGLTVAADGTVWACGSQGTVLRFDDEAGTCLTVGPALYPELEFRSLHAWTSDQAVIASAGQPAMILRTEDGGQSWHEVFRHESSGAFFDALKFWDDDHGIVFGDPIDGRIMVAVSKNASESWSLVEPQEGIPAADPMEAGFAASNSSLALQPDGLAWIGLGGGSAGPARLLRSSDWGQHWQAVLVPPIDRGPSSGIFSLAFTSPLRGVAVGGDYQQPTLAKNHIAVTEDGGLTWRLPKGTPPRGYRSAAIHIPQRGFVCAGPSGIDASENGDNWLPVSDEGFHTLAVSPDGQLWAAGSEGRIAKIKLD